MPIKLSVCVDGVCDGGVFLVMATFYDHKKRSNGERNQDRMKKEKIISCLLLGFCAHVHMRKGNRSKEEPKKAIKQKIEWWLHTIWIK